MVSNKVILGFVLCNIIIAGGAYLSYSSSLPDVETHSLLIREIDQPVELYQIKPQGVEKVWTSDYVGIDHLIVEVDDLENDGRQEVIVFNQDTTLYLLDLETGEELWRQNLRSIIANTPELFIRDLDGDGNKEIVIKRNTSNTELANETVQVFSHTGEVLQKVPVSQSNAIKGPSNIRLNDMDNDGNMELIMSYGHVLWNYNASTGSYRLEKYSWDPTDQQFELITQVSGMDNGGNTDLEIIDVSGEKYVVTSGWYNNPIRVFDADLNLVWSQVPYDTTEFIQLADSRIEYYVDELGQSHLIVAMNNYWTNATLSIFDFDPITGVIRNEISFDNLRNIFLTHNSEFLYISSFEQVDPNSEERINIVRILDAQDLALLETIQNPVTDRYNMARANFDTSFNIVETAPYPSVMVRRSTGSLEMINPINSFPVLNLKSSVLDMIKVVPTPDLNLEGEALTSYGNLDITVFIIYLVIIELSIALAYLGKDSIFEYIDNTRLKDDWKLKAYLRMKPIFEQSYHTTPLLSTGDFSIYPLALPAFDFSDLNIPEPEAYSNEQLDIDVRDWYDNNADRLKKLKATDFVILVTFLESSAAMTPADILDHVKVTAKSTIYRRVNFLSQLELLEARDNIEDQRSTKYQLTNLGISFLKSFHYVLTSIMN